MIGETLGHYTVRRKIGEGGMGEVYLAHDADLEREVALKLLPEAFAADPERVTRFQREARTLASLNHPNIASIYGLGEEGERRFLVMEFVEGEDLSERIQRGPLAQEDALDIAHQIADGLEQAHEQGIVHRDLKPANVKVTPEGNVKLLDFGLARVYEPDVAPGSDLRNSPTITSATQAGIIMGTAAYMSPEQAKGKPVDRRTDVWAFGVVLWEMLTGKSLFQGEDVSETLAAVLRQELPWTDLPAHTPAPVRRLLERCLERDVRRRLRDIGEARVRLETWTQDPSTLVAPVPGEARAARRFAWLPWSIALLGVTLGALTMFSRGDREPPPAMKFRLDISSGLLPATDIQTSPDGTQFAYRTPEGIRLRRFDQPDTRLLSGTQDASEFTFSPDGQWIAFFAKATYLRVSVTGGAPSKIADGQPIARGLAWVNPATLVVSPYFSGGLEVISIETGETRELTTLDETTDERSHRWPVALPDGRSVLFLCQFEGHEYDEGEIRVASVDDGEVATVHRGGAAPRYASSGHLLFARDNTVFAIPFDRQARTTSGLAVPVLHAVQASVNDQQTDDGSAQYDVSPQGILIYQTASGSLNQPIRALEIATGTVTTLGEPSSQDRLIVSLDGTRLAVERSESGSRLYVVDTQSGTSTRVTFAGGGVVRVGCWAPDSETLYYSQYSHLDTSVVMVRNVNSSVPPAELFRAHGRARPTDVSRDGRFLLSHHDTGLGPDIWLYALATPDATPELLIGGPGGQMYAKFSPDGRWIAYVERIDETRGAEIYVRRFPDTGVKWRVAATRGNTSYSWNEDGSAILLRHAGGMARVAIDIRGESPVIGESQPIVGTDRFPNATGVGDGAFTADGSWVYTTARLPDEENPSRVVLVTDWLTELETLAPR